MITLALVTGMFASAASGMDDAAGDLTIAEPTEEKVVTPTTNSNDANNSDASNSTDTETKPSVVSKVTDAVSSALSSVKDGVTGTEAKTEVKTEKVVTPTTNSNDADNSDASNSTDSTDTTDAEAKTSILSSVKNGVTGAASSVKNGVYSAGSSVKNGVTGTTSWGWNKTKDSTSAAYGFVWGSRNKWVRASEAVVAITGGAYVLNNMFGDDVKEMLGFEPTEDNCDVCA